MINVIAKKYSDNIQAYLDYIINNSTPQMPLWNKELFGLKAQKWNYIDGCMLTALFSMYEKTGKSQYFDFFIKFLDYYINEDGSIKGYDKLEYNIDNISGGRVLFDAYRITFNQKYLLAIENLHSQLLTHPRTKDGNFWHKLIYPNQVWLDGLYMAQVFYTRYQTKFGSADKYNDIVNQFKNVRKYMFDQSKKLYFHGFDSTGLMFWCKSNKCSSSFWLRSIGWYAAALTDVIFYMDNTDPVSKNYLKDLLKELLTGILKYSDEKSGMFWQVVDMAEREGNYLETSGSSMISYALAKADKLGIINTKFAKAGYKCFNGICEKYLYVSGNNLHLGGICLVAGLGPDNNRRRDGTYEYYISEPIVEDDAKGLGPFLLAYTEII